MADGEWVNGWQADGSYIEDFFDRPSVFLADRMDRVGLTIRAKGYEPLQDFAYEYEYPKARKIRWIPIHEGARLWLMMNAPDY